MDKSTTMKYLVIVLSIALLTCIYLLWQAEAYSKAKDEQDEKDAKNSVNFIFNRGVDDSTAWEHMSEYSRRFSFRQKAMGVWYEPDSIINYMKTVFPRIKKEIKLPDTCKGCKWVIGFYFMRKIDTAEGHKKIPKLDFYVVPTIYDSAHNILYDFANEKFRRMYARIHKMTDDGKDTTAFDAGHIWP